MMYAQPNKRRWPRRMIIVLLCAVLLVVGATAVVRYTYSNKLQAVSNSEDIKLFTVKSGATVEQIGNNLQSAKLIRSAWAFKLYVSSKEVRSALQAGEYELQPRMSVAEIVSVLTHGKVATNLVTILPGKRIDQIQDRLLEDGFSKEEVATALDPATYAGNSALVDKPASASLEGYIYPDSYQKTSTTTAKDIITASLTEMGTMITPDMRSAFAKQGLSTYQGIVLASIIEREALHDEDRPQIAQVFLSRLKIGMNLQSDATKYYYDSYTNAGLPPMPISNMSKASLDAAAHPSDTDWLFFVAGDNGTTYFSKTFEEHEKLVQQYCQEGCAQ